MAVLSPGAVPPEPGEQDLAAVEPTDLAVIQFSSGSTGAPKGAAISHGNIVANLHAIASRAHDDESDTCCSWLPMFHDMGLIALLRPVVFQLSLRADGAGDLPAPGRRVGCAPFRTTAPPSPEPNFAFDLCVRKVDERELADVGSVELAPGLQRRRTHPGPVMEAFIARFSRYGFRRTTMYPCYGMSEFTLAAPCPRRIASCSAAPSIGARSRTEGYARPPSG